jgi:hypothetical protein
MAGQTGGAVRVVLDFLFLLYQVYSSKNSKPGKVTLGKEALHKNRLFEWCTEARHQVWFCSLNDNPFGGGIANPA